MKPKIENGRPKIAILDPPIFDHQFLVRNGDSERIAPHTHIDHYTYGEHHRG
jgi:hypothetical protein